MHRHIAQHRETVARIVIDEAHQVLSQNSFRSAWNKISRIGGVVCQKILLTASIPLRDVTQLLKDTSLPPDCHLVRDKSSQPRISFHQVPFKNLQPIPLIIAIARYLEVSVLKRTGLGIIYCRTKKQVEALAKAFGCCYTYSKRENRDEIELAWMTGLSGQWICATTALSQGIDASNVCVTLFWDLPYGLVNLYQASGRGGRAGQPSYSVMVYNTNQHYEVEATDFGCLAEGIEWLGALECRRLGFSRLFDNEDIACGNLHGCNKCDFCDPSSAHSQVLQRFPTFPSDQLKKYRPAAPDNPDDIYGDGVENTTLPVKISSSGMISEPGPSSSGLMVQRANVRSSDTPAALRTSTTHSIQSLTQTKLYTNQQAERRQKLKVLENMVNAAAGNCVICWLWQGAGTHHPDTVFETCGITPTSMPRDTQGWSVMKNAATAKLEPYKYCFKCHLPQDDTSPFTKHPTPGSGDCTCPNMIPYMVWYIYHQKQPCTEASHRFPAFGQIQNYKQLTDWYSKNDSGDFMNGVELVIWYIQKYLRLS